MLKENGDTAAQGGKTAISVEGIIADIERRVQDKILEPSNAELLKKLIRQADNINEAISIAELGTTYNRTGFYFDKRLEPATNAINYFKENKALSFTTDPNLKTHKLIIGDNYPALLNLLVQYRGKIDVIYIDPPYGKDSMGDFAKTNYENAITRDNLLSMLYPRLVLAKQLLSESGVIFCSIDDKNQAYVKGLFDEVFEEKNFVGCAPRKTGAGAAATRGDAELRDLKDFLLIYKKDDTCFRKKIIGQKEFPLSDSFGEYRLSQFQASGSDATEKARPNLYYPIFLLDNGTLTTMPSIKGIAKTILPTQVNGENGRWMWAADKFEKDNSKYIVWNGNKLQRKMYFDENQDQTIYQVEKLWLDGFSNSSGTIELNDIFDKKGFFKNPKPVDLIKWCVNLHPSYDAIILDFFAGSGTTGQAVLELNKQDGGNRQFILCTNNEVTDTTPNGIAVDVTTKRLKRVMTGQCYDGTNNFKWLEKNKPLGDNLQVLDIAQVADFEDVAGKTPFDVIDETLYGQQKFATLKEKIEWVIDNFELTQKQIGETTGWLKEQGVK